jgi:probable F420-dependent oxidoreductase
MNVPERTSRPIRFGVSATAANESSAKTWREFARKAEDLGFAVLLLGDHMGRSIAPLLALQSAADATSRLRVSPQVLANDFRNPALLAKEIATIDMLTEGRFEAGIGTGWPSGSPNAEADYRQLGIPLDEPGPRVSRLAETLQIIKRFMESEQPVDFTGKYYDVRGLITLPRPVQKPRPPIMLAGAGPRILKLAAREVDIINLAPRPPIVGRTARGSVGFGLTMGDTVSIVREAAGDRYAGIELAVFANNPAEGNPSITSNPGPLIDKLAAELHTSREATIEMPATMIGSVDEIIDRVQREREQYDISYRIIPSYAMDDFAPVVARLAGT